MKWWSPFTVAVALLASAPTVSADWLMERHDAAGTGHAEGEAPAWNDVAFVHQFDEPLEQNPAMIVVDGKVYLFKFERSTPGLDIPTDDVSLFSLTAVDLASGAVTTVADDLVVPGTPPNRAAMASDGTRIFMLAWETLFTHWIANETTNAGIAIPLMSRSGIEVQGIQGNDLGTYETGKLVVQDGRLYMAMSPRYFDGTSSPVSRVAVLDIETGTFVYGPFPDTPGNDAFPNEIRQPEAGYSVVSLNVANGVAIVTLRNFFGGGPGSWVGVGGRIWAVDTTSSGPLNLWAHDYPYLTTDRLWDRIAPSMLVGDTLYAKLFPLFAFEAATGTYSTGNDQVRSGIEDQGDFGSGWAASGDSLFAAVWNRLYSVDANLVPVWRTDIEGQSFQSGGLIVMGDIVLGLASTGANDPLGGMTSSTLYAFDATSGAQLWRHNFAASAIMAASDGIIAVWSQDGQLTILGELPISIHAKVSNISKYPQPGEVVRVDLGSTVPGLLGSAMSYHAEWGDGEVDDWQESPNFSHVYATIGDAQARFSVRNDAGQTSSVPITFHVGQEDPGLSVIERALRPQNQNSTFFVVGLMVTLFAALAGVLLRGRKRRRMHREMERLEAIYRQHRTDAETCEPRLVEAKKRFRSMLEKRRLEEGQFGILTDRADELLGRLRMGTVEEDFAFLPLGVARTLQRMLRDGRVTAAERSFVLDAVRQDAMLTAAQKAKVKAQVERWFRSDAYA